MIRSLALLAVVCILAATEEAEGVTVVLHPGDNIQALVNANPTSTTFLFNAGTYSMQSIIPKSGSIFDGQGLAILDGNNLTKTAFRGTATSVTIKNLTIQNYKSDLQMAAVDAEFGNAWIIENNTIQGNYNVGVNFGDNTQVLGNRLLNNGQSGFAGGGEGWLVENNQIGNNNTRGLEWGFEAGGGKVTEATSGTFRGNRVFGNGGPGIWLDIAANNILIENNYTANNLGPGIMVEISRNATVRNNTVVNNGESFRWDNAGILISSSEGNKIYGNMVDVPANGLGIFVMSQGREYTAIDNDIYDNEIWLRGTRAGVQGADRDDDAPVYATNNFHDNTYYVRNLSSRYFSWETDYTLSQAQAQQKELGSDMILSIGDYNRDGLVDAADYTTWRDSFGAPYTNTEYDLWKTHFGTAIGGAAANDSSMANISVPEPTTLLLSLLGMLAAVGRRGEVRVLRSGSQSDRVKGEG